MNKWVEFLESHGTVERLTNDTCIMFDTSYILNVTRQYFNDIIHKQPDGTYLAITVYADTDKCIVWEINTFETIKEYLNY